MPLPAQQKRLGLEVPVSVRFGSYTSPPLGFDYDPPFVQRINPYTPDAAGDRIEFTGSNFGETEGLAGAVNVTIGGRACSPAAVGGQDPGARIGACFAPLHRDVFRVSTVTSSLEYTYISYTYKI